MIAYRSFRNSDVPALAAVWNQSIQGRGVAVPVSASEFDSIVLIKPHFDRHGLTLACDATRIVGFAHAGFGCTADGWSIDRQSGTIAMVVVHPEYRHRGVGRELVARSEQYLRQSGALVRYAGCMHPIDPFYLGLYGGSEMPGVLESNADAQAFFRRLGYHAADTCVVLQRDLGSPVVTIDPRFRSLSRRLRFEVRVPREETWWSAAQRGLFDTVEFRAVESNAVVVGRTLACPLPLFERTWQKVALGLYSFEVPLERRRKGIGRWLLYHILRQLREDGIQCIEVQAMQRNSPALGLYTSLGFIERDRGSIFRAPAPTEMAVSPAVDPFTRGPAEATGG